MRDCGDRRLEQARIHLQVLDHTDADRTAELLTRDRADGLVPDDERMRCLNVADRSRGRARLAAHIALRLALAEHGDRENSRSKLVFGRHGKPKLPGAAFFSLAHADGASVIAVCSECCVGADVERLRPVTIAQRVQLDVIGHVRACWPDAMRGIDENTTFLAAWTALEAATKATGDAMHSTLDGPVAGSDGNTLLRPPDRELTIVRPPLPAGFIGACCAPARNIAIIL